MSDLNAAVLMIDFLFILSGLVVVDSVDSVNTFGSVSSGKAFTSDDGSFSDVEVGLDVRLVFRKTEVSF